MVYVFSIVLFFFYSWSLGSAASFLAKESENFLERNLMRLGIGMAAIPFLGLLLNLLSVPIDWRIFLLASFIYPLIQIIYYFSGKKPKPQLSLRITKESLSIIAMLIIFAANLYIHVSGAFAYPYLENDDSWSHAVAVKYVAIQKTVFDGTNAISYIDAYPPSYDLVMGLLHQTNDSVYFTLKFFNAFIVASSIIFFYFFMKRLTGSRNKALFAAFVLFSLPAFMSHFIWALPIAVTLYFVAFYCLEMIGHDRKWIVPAAIVMTTVLIASPTHSAYFAVLLGIYFVCKIAIEGKFSKHQLAAIALAAVLSFSLWWGVMLIKHGVSGTLEGVGFSFSVVKEAGASAAFRGTGDRLYNFDDFYAAKDANMVNNPIGIGKTVLVLVFLSFAISYFYLISLLKKAKDASKINYWLNFSIIVLSFISLLIGILYWKSTGAMNPSSKQLEETLRSSLPYIFAGILLMAVSFVLLLRHMDPSRRWILLALVWFVFAFYSVNASIYPIKISPFRAWMILAIPVAMLAAESLSFLYSAAKSSVKNFWGTGIAFLLVLILAFGVYSTSLKQKIAVNTSPNWPVGGFWTSGEEVQGHIWMHQNIPKNSNVFTFANNGPVLGFDMYTCHWCSDVRDFQKRGYNSSVNEISLWLKSHGYEYLLIDGQTSKKIGVNETNTMLQNMIESGKFKPSFGNNGLMLLKVV